MNWTELHDSAVNTGSQEWSPFDSKAMLYTALRLLKNGRQRHEMEHIFDHFMESTSTICKPYQNSFGENSYV